MPGTKTLHLPSSVLTGGVALPRRAENEVLAEQGQIVEQMDSMSSQMLHFTNELRHRFSDPYLKVVLAKPNTTVNGLKPNYYHVIRFEPGKPLAIMPVEDPETGEWRDLGEWVFDMVARADLQNDRTQRMLRRAQAKNEQARQHDKIRRGQDRAAEFDDRLKHAVNVYVSIPRSIKP